MESIEGGLVVLSLREKCERVSSGLMRAALMRFSQAAHCGLIEEIFLGTFRLLSRAQSDQKSLLASFGLFDNPNFGDILEKNDILPSFVSIVCWCL